MERVDAIVIGAGVVGLAIARALAMRGHETVLLEAADAFGTGTSSRNSEVIHAGIYYPAGSLKARLCVDGRTRLYAYCESRQVAHRRCGKLIVATDAAQRPALVALQARAERHGVSLRWVERDELGRIEPALSAVAALESPATGIVDSHGLMLALLGDAEAHGAMLALRSPVVGVTPGAVQHVVSVGGEAASEIAAPIVVNAAGLSASRVAACIAGWPAERLPRMRFAKGNYFAVAGRSPFSRLIYPVPEPGGLGVHLTLDLGGQARFGPDVEWLDEGLDATDPATIDYRVDPARRHRFETSVRRYWPDLPDDALQPAYSGVRPKLVGPGEPDADFSFDGPAEHGVACLLNLYGIESPGLTACLAIADEAMRRLGV